MGSEDWFLRLDEYNFDTEEDYWDFYYGKKQKEVENGSGFVNSKRSSRFIAFSQKNN